MRQGRQIVGQADLEESVETVIAGAQRKNAVLSEKDKRTVAYHETGHALVAALQTEQRARHQDYDSPAHLRRAGLHDAGRRGRSRPS